MVDGTDTSEISSSGDPENPIQTTQRKVQDDLAWEIKKSLGGIPNSRNVSFLYIFLKRAAKPRAGNTSAGFPWIKRPQILLNLTWLCTKAFQTFSGTFSRTLLNLTWLCTKASHTFSGTYWNCSTDLALNQSLPDLLQNLLRNPVELDPALHQSLPDLLRNLSRPSWTWPGSAPNLHTGTLESETLLNLTLLCTKASWNLLRNLLRNPVEPDLTLHQRLPDLLRNLRNLLRNLVEPDPAPAPVHTGAILGWRPH